MVIKPNDKFIRYTGRWSVTDAEAYSTANGNYLEFAFLGETAVVGFNTAYMRVPFPHIYISVDNGAKIDVPIDRFIRINAYYGEHKVQIILKGSVEYQHRWYSPIEAKVGLLEIEAESFISLPEDNRPVIEFIGDSITEGISIDTGYSNYKSGDDMIYSSDATAGYAWLTASLLDMRPVTMGYGCLGITQGGAGGVPRVCDSYLYYNDGNLKQSTNADYIVINHGTNDRNSDKECFIQGYKEFLKLVRKNNKSAKIISLTPFSGCLAGEICKAVREYNTENDDKVFFIDSTGWISPEPLHPTRDGHKTVSRKLSAYLKEKVIKRED